MRASEVPQDGSRTHPGERKLAYALDDEGRYVQVPYTGWEVEELVTRSAVEEFERLAEEAYERGLCGESSPLEYHMYARRMDVQVLSQSTGFLRMTVRRHLRPRAFARLKAARLQRYAEVLGLDVERLVRLPERSEAEAARFRSPGEARP